MTAVPERVLVLGANGPTGRLTVQQGLDRGHHVVALTRHPESFPFEHERLRVVAGDATDPAVIDAALADVDAVICVLGASFTSRPVEVYSATARLLVDAMERTGPRRLIAVTSAGVSTTHDRGGVVQRTFAGLMRDRIGKTVYDDMVAMESLVSAGDLDWTVVRPPGLVTVPGNGYAVAQDDIEGGFCAREDLAAMLLDQLGDDRFVRKVAAVSTPGLRASIGHMVWREMLKR